MNKTIMLEKMELYDCKMLEELDFNNGFKCRCRFKHEFQYKYVNIWCNKCRDINFQQKTILEINNKLSNLKSDFIIFSMNEFGICKLTCKNKHILNIDIDDIDGISNICDKCDTDGFLEEQVSSKSINWLYDTSKASSCDTLSSDHNNTPDEFYYESDPEVLSISECADDFHQNDLELYTESDDEFLQLSNDNTQLSNTDYLIHKDEDLHIKKAISQLHKLSFL